MRGSNLVLSQLGVRSKGRNCLLWGVQRHKQNEASVLVAWRDIETAFAASPDKCERPVALVIPRGTAAGKVGRKRASIARLELEKGESGPVKFVVDGDTMDQSLLVLGPGISISHRGLKLSSL
jgi:hypothetical protein